MRSSMRSLVEVGLLAAILLMAALVLAPWKERPLPGAAASTPTAPSAAMGSQPDSQTVVSADLLVPLFLGAPRTPPAPVVAPVDAAWLRYLGRSSADDGKSYVYVKDTRSGRVFQATRGEYLNGWMLIEENDASFVLKNADGTFVVSKR